MSTMIMSCTTGPYKATGATLVDRAQEENEGEDEGEDEEDEDEEDEEETLITSALQKGVAAYLGT